MEGATHASPAVSGKQGRTMTENVGLFIAAYLTIVYAISPFLVCWWTKSIERTKALFGKPSLWAGVLTSINWLLYSLAVLKTDACLELAISYSLILMAGSGLLFVYGNDKTRWEGFLLASLLLPSIGFFIFVIRFEFSLPKQAILPLGVIGLISLVVCHFFQICDILKISAILETAITVLTLTSSAAINLATVYITFRWHPDQIFILASSFLNLTCNVIEFLMLCRTIKGNWEANIEAPPPPSEPPLPPIHGNQASGNTEADPSHPSERNVKSSTIQGGESEDRNNGPTGQELEASTSPAELRNIVVVSTQIQELRPACEILTENAAASTTHSKIPAVLKQESTRAESIDAAEFDIPSIGDHDQKIAADSKELCPASHRPLSTDNSTEKQSSKRKEHKSEEWEKCGRSSPKHSEILTVLKHGNSMAKSIDAAGYDITSIGGHDQSTEFGKAPSARRSLHSALKATENSTIPQSKSSRKRCKMKQKPEGSVRAVGEERRGLFCLPRGVLCRAI